MCAGGGTVCVGSGAVSSVVGQCVLVGAAIELFPVITLADVFAK